MSSRQKPCTAGVDVTLQQKSAHTHTSSVKTCLLWLRILNLITTMIQLEIFSRWLYTVFAWNIRSPTGRAWPFRCWVPRTSSLRWVKGVPETKDTAYCIPLKRATCGTMLHSQVVQNTTQPMRRFELQAPTGHHTNVSPCLASLGLQKSRWRLVLAGPAFRAPIILEPFNAIPKSRYCRTMAFSRHLLIRRHKLLSWWDRSKAQSLSLFPLPWSVVLRLRAKI